MPGLIPKFINRKHGREAIDFAHSTLEPILSETYGIMVSGADHAHCTGSGRLFP